MTPTLFRSLVP